MQRAEVDDAHKKIAGHSATETPTVAPIPEVSGVFVGLHCFEPLYFC